MECSRRPALVGEAYFSLGTTQAAPTLLVCMAGASRNAAIKFLLLAVLVVCALQAVPASEATSGTGGLLQGRALKTQSITIVCNDVTSQCPAGGWWLCSEGPAKGDCRSKSQGRYPRADCKSQCYVDT
ncbi:hypothetical protein ABBQ32_009767 [Trebouxia sp. C0010 RCD-2024]